PRFFFLQAEDGIRDLTVTGVQACALPISALSIVGVRVSVANEVKPVLERGVNEQLAILQERIRSDPVIEQAARREWVKMCRSIRSEERRVGKVWGQRWVRYAYSVKRAAFR